MSDTKMGIHTRCCRLCLAENKETLEDFSMDVKLRENILTVLSIEIKDEDAISKYVCQDCSQKMKNWCAFKQNCQKNQSIILPCRNEGGEMGLKVKEEANEDTSTEEEEVIEETSTEEEEVIEETSTEEEEVIEDTSTGEEDSEVTQGNITVKMEPVDFKDLDDEDVALDLSKYVCITCNKHFMSYTGYNEHNMKHHAEKQSKLTYPRKCDECDKIITRGSAFASHKAMHMRMREQLARLTNPNSMMVQKTKKSNPESKDDNMCKKCFKVFSTKYNLKKHMKLHGINMTTTRTSKSPKQFFNRCNVNFANAKVLNNHIDEEHVDKRNLELKQDTQKAGPSNINATYSNRGFECAFDLEEHMMNHSENPVVKTNKTSRNKSFGCKNNFSSKRAMYSQMGWHKSTNNEGPSMKRTLVQTPSNPKKSEFECLTCGQELPNDIALEIHKIEKHGNMAALLALRCDSCKQNFATVTDYENHMKLHKIFENKEAMKVTFKSSPGCSSFLGW